MDYLPFQCKGTTQPYPTHRLATAAERNSNKRGNCLPATAAMKGCVKSTFTWEMGEKTSISSADCRMKYIHCSQA